MPRFEITSPDGKKFEINAPEGATQDQALEYAQKQFSQPKGDTLELAPEPSALDNGIAGFKKAFTDIGQGLGQVAGTVSREDVARTRAADQPLMDTTSGTVGNVLGNVTAALPAAFIPGVNGVVGGMALGSVLGAIAPSTSNTETAANTGFGAIGWGIGAKISQFLAGRAAKREARSALIKPTIDAKNAALADAQKSGYVVPPQDAGAGAFSQILNAISGKVKTEQKASVLNQSVTNAKAAREIGLPENQPITLDALNGVRDQAGKAYEAVRGVGQIRADNQFRDELQGIVQRFQSASKDFPELLNNDVLDVVKSVGKSRFDADSAIDAIGILRKKADAAYRGGNNEVGAASKKAAEALENVIGRHLQNSGAPQNLINDFQNARTLIAKTYTVQKALNQSSGNVNAGKLAAEQKKKGTLTGELADIAKFAGAHPKANQELAGVNPYSVIDGGAAVGGAFINPAITAYVAGRPIVRSMVLNPTYQKMFVKGKQPSGSLTSMMRKGSKVVTPLSAMAGSKSNKEED